MSHTPPEDTHISKTQLKNEMTELQKVAESLTKMPNKHLLRIPLPEPLLDAIKEARRITQREAQRRHFQYMGKLIRAADYETIIVAIEKITSPYAGQHIALLRDKLIEGATNTETVLLELTNADRQQVRQLTRNAQKEFAVNEKKPEGEKPDNKHSQKLFKYLRQCDQNKPIE